MKNTAKNKILARIYGRGRGWSFSPNDFMPDFKRFEIDNSLRDLLKEGKIRRIMQGVYDYPLYSELLNKNVAPDMEQVAYALARKFGWRIQPTGDTALNYLGLSTQMLGQSVYLSDGPSKTYEIDGQKLDFKHTLLKEAALKNHNSALVVQSLKAMGEENISSEFLEKLRDKFSLEEWKKIKTDAAKAIGWVYKCISRIAEDLGDK